MCYGSAVLSPRPSLFSIPSIASWRRSIYRPQFFPESTAPMYVPLKHVVLNLPHEMPSRSSLSYGMYKLRCDAQWSMLAQDSSTGRIWARYAARPKQAPLAPRIRAYATPTVLIPASPTPGAIPWQRWSFVKA